MSIKKYTNVEQLNDKSENEGKFIQKDDLFIVSKNQIKETDFGDCKYDVMEVSIYDINNNLLPQKTGNNVAYIKTGDIKNYMFNVTNKGGQKELAIDIEKLLNDLGFTNGILKVNLNFVRYKVGSENELERVWIQEISPSREEIRILPLKTKEASINEKTKKEINDLQSLNKEFKYYKNSVLDLINSFENTFLSKIDDSLETKYGKDFFTILKKDFGLSKFDSIKKQIFDDFKTSVEYYLYNKNYDIAESNFGKPAGERFGDCDSYDFPTLIKEIQSILFKCIDFNLKGLKRREIGLKQTPKEFSVVELQKQIQDNLDAFDIVSNVNKNTYSPDGTAITLDDTVGIVVTQETPVYTAKGTLLSTLCKGYDRYGNYADGKGGSYEELIEVNSATCGYIPPSPPPPPPPSGGGSSGGGSGGGTVTRDRGTGMGREVIYDDGSERRENIK
jgi:hypothetical protein